MSDPRYDTGDGTIDAECECGWDGKVVALFSYGPYGRDSRTVTEWTCPECNTDYEREN
jgi:hypothetical protein